MKVRDLVIVSSIICVLPSVALAARRAPASGVGGMPYQAPLQPIPGGVGANISNNIQQAPDAGTPDSASVVAPPDSGSASAESTSRAAKTTGPTVPSTPSRSPLAFVWFGVLLGIGLFIFWLWRVTHKRAVGSREV
jgi:hypothetical protein